MDFCGNKNGKRYTLTLKGDKVTSILVESLTDCNRWFYQRGPVKLGLTIDEKIFREAVLAICQEQLAMWSAMYEMLPMDDDYSQNLIEKIFKENFHKLL